MRTLWLCFFWDISISYPSYHAYTIDILLQITNIADKIYIYSLTCVSKQLVYFFYFCFLMKRQALLMWIIFILWIFWFLYQWDYLQIQWWASLQELQSQWVAWELRISPFGVQDKLLDRIVQSKYTIDMWFYRITLSEAEQVFKNLASLWLDIRRIWENRPYEWLDKNFLKLRDRFATYGIQVYDDEQMWTNFNHAKVIISDDDRFLISTANLTYTSMRKNREYRFAGTHTWVVDSLQTIFDKDVTWQIISTDDIDSSLLICPVNCRQQIELLLRFANKSIVIQAQYLQDDSIVDILLDRQNEIELNILVGKWQNEGWLHYFDPGVVRLLKDPYIHAKNILIDDEVLMMWSMNLSENALDNNREIGILIDDSRSMSSFSRQFQKDREIATEYVDRDFEKDWF